MRATQYLENQYKTLNRPYSMALTAYALSLVNSSERFKANERLVQNAVYDNGSCMSLHYRISSISKCFSYSDVLR